jgi:hypothetical protein
MRPYIIKRFTTTLAILLLTAEAFGQIQFDKPKGERRLPNPSIISASRDEAMTAIKQMLETREIPVEKEDCNAITGECIIACKPVIFIKGIQTRSQLEHYAEVPAAVVRNWAKGRYTLRIHVSPASPKTSQIAVYARFEGMTDGVIGTEWVQLASKGELEDKILRCIQERILGGECKEETDK